MKLQKRVVNIVDEKHYRNYSTDILILILSKFSLNANSVFLTNPLLKYFRNTF